MRKNIFPFILYLYEMMEVHKTYCTHFMIYVGRPKQYAVQLTLYSAVYPLYLSKTVRGKKTPGEWRVSVQWVEFQLGKMIKFWSWVVVTDGYNSVNTPYATHLQTVDIVNFALWIFNFN